MIFDCDFYDYFDVLDFSFVRCLSAL